MEPLTDKKLRSLALVANDIRQDIMRMLAKAGSGHSGGSLGMTDVFTALFFHIMKHNPKKPLWDERDRMLLSNGHIAPVYYATLARAGYFPLEELMTLRQIGTRLQGHPHRGALPGIESTSGPLGCGLSQAIGMALAARLDQKKRRFYVLTSDGEHQEGSVWEAVMAAAAYRLSNIIAIMDRNNIQIDGDTEKVMPLEPLREKYEAFGWHVIDIDGHSFEAIISAVAEAQVIHERPTMILAHTVIGRGVSFMENDYRWHGMPPGLSDVSGAPPKGEQLDAALRELQAAREALMAQ